MYFVSQYLKLIVIDEAHFMCHFFNASYFEPLPFFNNLDKLSCLKQRQVCLSIQPGNAPAQYAYIESAPGAR